MCVWGGGVREVSVCVGVSVGGVGVSVCVGGECVCVGG